MRTHNHLWKSIISMENIKLACDKASEGKKDNPAVKRFEQCRRRNLLKLRESLINKTFTTSEYNVHEIHDAKGHLAQCLPFYPDQIVHHAIINVLGPIWTKVLPYNTYAGLKRRGVFRAFIRTLHTVNKYPASTPVYCLKIDIHHCYPDTNHEVLKRTIRRSIRDKDVLWLLDNIIDSCEGLPIGNYLSIWLANLMFGYMLHKINEAPGVQCIEYADDFVFISDDKQKLWDIFNNLVKPYVEEKLLLTINENWRIFKIGDRRRPGSSGVDFVGYVIYRNHVAMRKKIKKNLLRRLKALEEVEKQRPLSHYEYLQFVSPWMGWMKYCHTTHFVKVHCGIHSDFILYRLGRLRDPEKIKKFRKMRKKFINKSHKRQKKIIIKEKGR